jgi:photosystem II stability/assembly factor-like uncharacterized protein
MLQRSRATITRVGALTVLLIVLLTMSVQAQEPGFTEDFEDAELPGWERSPNAEVVDGYLHVESEGFALRPGAWNDLNVRVRVRLEGEGILAVSYRISEMGEYALQIHYGELSLLRGGELLAKQGMALFEPGEWFDLEIFCLEGHNEILINGEPILVMVDSDPLPPGGVALAVHGDALGSFDDLTVSPLGEGSAPEEPEEKAPEPTEAAPMEEPGGAESGSGGITSDLTWVRTGGPPGGIGYDIRYKFDEEDTWFVTDNFAGVHISHDDGLTWQPSNVGIPGQLGPTGDWRPIFSLTIDPHNPDIIWAGTDKTGHIYKSTDGGQTWKQKDNGVNYTEFDTAALTFRGFTVDPNSSDIVYAMGEVADLTRGGAEVWGTTTGGVVYKTADGGENWDVIWDGGIPSSLARYMWIDPNNTDILYVSTGIFDRGAVNEGDPAVDPDPYGGLGILKSVDGGATWRVLNEANGLDFLYVSSLFMHPQDANVLLAATGKYESELYLEYVRENGIETKMGLYRTTDGGETWEQVISAGGGFTSVEICPSDPDVAYVASGNFVYRSEDSGVTWTMVAGQGGGGWGPPGVLAGTPIDLQCDPADPERIFSNNYVGGNFLSEDGGVTWQNASDGYTGAQIISVAVDPANPARIYAGGRTGIWTSGDGGGSWSGLRNPPAGQPVWGGEFGAIVVDPGDSNHLLASEETVWESFDVGASWEIRRTPAFALASSIEFAPSDPKIVYTGQAEPLCLFFPETTCKLGHGVYVSRDGGTTWDFANDANIDDLALIDLAVDDGDPQQVYAATQRGLFKTTDGGGNWSAVIGLPEDVRVSAVTIDPSDTRRLFAGVETHGLYESTDGGETWTQIAAGLPPNSGIRDVLFDPANTHNVYLSDVMSGVYRSTDGGQSWTLIVDGLTTRSTTGLAISSDGLHLYAATNGEGVFRLDLNGEPPVSTQVAPVEESPAAKEELSEEVSISPVEEKAPQRATVLFVGIGVGLILLIAAFLLVRRTRRGGLL